MNRDNKATLPPGKLDAQAVQFAIAIRERDNAAKAKGQSGLLFALAAGHHVATTR